MLLYLLIWHLFQLVVRFFLLFQKAIIMSLFKTEHYSAVINQARRIFPGEVSLSLHNLSKRREQNWTLLEFFLNRFSDLTMCLMNPRVLDDVSFHPCIRLKRWEVTNLNPDQPWCCLLVVAFYFLLFHYFSKLTSCNHSYKTFHFLIFRVRKYCPSCLLMEISDCCPIISPIRMFPTTLIYFYL